MLELAVALPVLLLILMGIIDFGRGYDVAIETMSAAEAGVAYGTLHPTDVSGMQAAAQLEAANVSTLVPTATWGCECSDGSSPSASCVATLACAVNSVQYVQVTTSTTYTPLFAWPGIPAHIIMKGQARSRVGN